MCGCPSSAPYWGPDAQPRHVPWGGIESVFLICCGMTRQPHQEESWTPFHHWGSSCGAATSRKVAPGHHILCVSSEGGRSLCPLRDQRPDSHRPGCRPLFLVLKAPAALHLPPGPDRTALRLRCLWVTLPALPMVLPSVRPWRIPESQ